ncbi:hypothetical protein LIA77_00071 [Sarocladium implicatum]|jgi:hypothetical protein|nr:hypothetical protein LIA77_00071 [Sarocladium implicatum]
MEQQSTSMSLPTKPIIHIHLAPHKLLPKLSILLVPDSRLHHGVLEGSSDRDRHDLRCRQCSLCQHGSYLYNEHGSITAVHSQPEYDALESKTKVGTVCSPDTWISTPLSFPTLRWRQRTRNLWRQTDCLYSFGWIEQESLLVVRCHFLHWAWQIERTWY